MKKEILPIASLLILGVLVSCTSKTSNPSSSNEVNNEISEQEVIDAAKKVVEANKDSSSLKISSNKCNIEANAIYTQTIHSEDYGFSFKNGKLDFEMKDYQNLDETKLQGYLELSGEYQTYCTVKNRDVVSTDESFESKLTLDKEQLYVKENTAYVSFSKELNKTITNDENASGRLNLYEEGYSGIFEDIIKNDNNSVLYPTEILNPNEMLQKLIEGTLYKNFLTYAKNGEDYSIEFTLNNLDLISLISKFSNSYASSIKVNEDNKVKIKVVFDEKTLKSMDVYTKINLDANFESLGKVKFNYFIDTGLEYSQTVSSIPNFQIDETFISCSDKEVDIRKIFEDQLDRLTKIYEQIISII